MRKAKFYWYFSMLFSIFFVYVCFVAGVMLSNIMGLKLEGASAGLIEMKSTLASFSSIYGFALAVGLAILLLCFAGMFGFKAEKSKT